MARRTNVIEATTIRPIPRRTQKSGLALSENMVAFVDGRLLADYREDLLIIVQRLIGNGEICGMALDRDRQRIYDLFAAAEIRKKMCVIKRRATVGPKKEN